MNDSIDVASAYLVNLLSIHGYEDDANTIFRIADAGEWSASQCYGIVLAHEHHIPIPHAIADAVLYTAEQEEDEEAIEVCKAILAAVQARKTCLTPSMP